MQIKEIENKTKNLNKKNVFVFFFLNQICVLYIVKNIFKFLFLSARCLIQMEHTIRKEKKNIRKKKRKRHHIICMNKTSSYLFELFLIHRIVEHNKQ